MVQIKEDDLTNELIEWQKSMTEKESSKSCEVMIEPEAHYNNYGSRGYLDLYVRRKHFDGTTEGRLYNIKSNPNNANEVIRQCRKEMNNFHKDRYKSDDIRFELCFLPTERNYEHVLENKSMYKALKSRNVLVTFRHPEKARQPIHLFTSACEIGDEKWKEYACRMGKFEFDLNNSEGVTDQ